MYWSRERIFICVGVCFFSLGVIRVGEKRWFTIDRFGRIGLVGIRKRTRMGRRELGGFECGRRGSSSFIKIKYKEKN